jgi:excisionase family DNA binding protein
MAQDRKGVGDDLRSEELSVSEMASKLGLNVSTVRAWIHQDRIPARKHGRTWLVREADIGKLLDEQPALGRPRRARGDRDRQPRAQQYDYDRGSLAPRANRTHNLKEGLGL